MLASRLVRLWLKADAWPVVCVRQKGVVAGVPHSSTYETILVHGLRVAECHAFGVDIFHRLKRKRKSSSDFFQAILPFLKNAVFCKCA